MNLSGIAVKPLVEKNEIALKDLILVYDELDLPWGDLRVKPKGSPAGHNGAKDVIAKLGSSEFPRVRLGVHPGHPLKSGADYLLSGFSRQQTETLEEFIGYAADATESIIAEGVEKSMTGFNRRAQGSNEE
jgi:PTH1 family peptidyl-tRNA hydrolase